ncbi:hypothetical protein CLV91_0658 [Maribacter vaceletii]|uniref:Uncharacterized protein n=1 Tax=Maribacter vaceletii TaxID=1206816 RepID=A0A495ECI5_9FLAO|nr:hypothetical protein [Maribacter vaceletii]RKR14580.1 hypothetical protein CLV91_0658 [Maribacter vaceletii]
MVILDNVLLGPFRVLLLFLGVLFVHQIVTKQPIKTYNLDYVVKRSIFFGSAILLLIFALVHFKMYDVFTLISLFIGLLLYLYLDLGSFHNSASQIQKKRKAFLLSFFKFMEERPNISKQVKKSKNFFIPKRINFKVLTAFLVSFACFVSRYLFLKNDLYTLSGLWIQNLEFVKQFNENKWFTPGFIMLGENALINFYSKITGISEEMAVHSFGLLETFAVSLILYWVVAKITKSNFLAPMIGVLFFGFFYKYLPININLLLEHNALYMAICFALPLMLFTVKPELLTNEKRKFFTLFFIVYTALGLINLFVALIIMPIFLVIAILLFTKKNLPYILRSILSYVSAISLISIVHVIACWYTGTSFFSFLRENIILVDVYTYFPQLIISIDELVLVYSLLGGITILVLLPLFIKNREKWNPAMVFLLFFNAIIALKWLKLSWIDIDLYYQSMSVLIVILIGIVCGVLVYYFKLSVPKKRNLRIISIASIFIVFISVSYFTNSFFKYDFKKTDELKTDILLVYNDLSSNYLPFSYAVVNQDYGRSISKSEHHFINYNIFTKLYSKRDSIYQTIKDDEELMKKNSSNILPNSVFVFIPKNNSNSIDENFIIKKETALETDAQINILKNRGRKVKVYFEDDFLTVYEIINKENASKLNDLIFDL